MEYTATRCCITVCGYTYEFEVSIVERINAPIGIVCTSTSDYDIRENWCFSSCRRGKLCATEVNHAFTPCARDLLDRQTAAAYRHGRAGGDIGITECERATSHNNVLQTKICYNRFIRAGDITSYSGVCISVAYNCHFFICSHCITHVDNLSVSTGTECDIRNTCGCQTIRQTAAVSTAGNSNHITSQCVLNKQHCFTITESDNTVIDGIRNKCAAKLQRSNCLNNAITAKSNTNNSITPIVSLRTGINCQCMRPCRCIQLIAETSCHCNRRAGPHIDDISPRLDHIGFHQIVVSKRIRIAETGNIGNGLSRACSHFILSAIAHCNRARARQCK